MAADQNHLAASCAKKRESKASSEEKDKSEVSPATGWPD